MASFFQTRISVLPACVTRQHILHRPLLEAHISHTTERRYQVGSIAASYLGNSRFEFGPLSKHPIATRYRVSATERVVK